MDDLRAALGAVDADAPLAGAPEPWDYLPTPGHRDGPPWATTEMIAAEPALAARVARRLVTDGSAARLADEVRAAAAAGGQVVVTGCGTSEHAAMGVAGILGDAWRIAGLPGAGPVAAQAFELAADAPGTGLVIGISHEGGTAATISALRAARAAGARTALITASAGAPVAAAADAVLSTVELDRSWCHTVGYVSPLVAAAVAADLLAGIVTAPGSLGQRLREGIDAAWATDPDGSRPARSMGETAGTATHLLVIGSGIDRVSARELALKVEEAAWVPATARDLETFLHGHLPATGPGTALILVLLEQGSLEVRAARARQALAAAAAVGMRPGAILGAHAASLIPDTLTPGGRVTVPDPEASGGAIGALLGAAGPLQLVTLAIAAARGTNPDPIRRDDPVYLRAAELAEDPTL